MRWPSITVIIPSLNCGKYIERTILSILKQKREGSVHVIVADGGSTDGTVDILKKYPQITWWSKPDKGVLDAIGQALKIADGEFLAFMPSDDFYLEDAWARLVPVLVDNTDIAFACGSIANLEQDGRRFSLSKQFDTRISKPSDYIFGRKWMSLQAGLVRRSCFYAMGGFKDECAICCDIDLFYRTLHFYEGILIPDYVAVFQRRENQITRSNGELWINSLKRMVKDCEKDENFPRPYRLSENEKRDFYLSCAMYFGDRADGTAGKEKAASLAAEILKEPSGYAKEVVNFARSLQPPQGGKDVRSQAKAGARRLLRALQLDDWVRYHILKRGTIEARIAASLNWWQGGRR